MNKFFIVLSMLFFLHGCGTDSNAPTEENLIPALKFKLPSYIKIDNLKIDVSESVGSKVEPVVRSRFKGKLVVTEDLYVKDKSLLTKKVLKKFLDSGSELDLFGITSSNFIMDKWIVNFDKIDVSPEPVGKPLSSFLKNSYVISGSEEEKSLIEVIKKKNESREKLLRENNELLVGLWEGEYICSGRATGVKFEVTKTSNSLLVNMKFYPLKSAPNRKKGSYDLNGTVNLDKKFKFVPKKWVDKPSGYHMVGFTGSVNEGGDEISGKVSGGCTSFEMKKL